MSKLQGRRRKEAEIMTETDIATETESMRETKRNRNKETKMQKKKSLRNVGQGGVTVRLTQVGRCCMPLKIYLRKLM